MTDRRTMFSPCRSYRYTLWREWITPSGLPLGGPNPIPLRGSSEFVQFIGLNPSTADEINNDPTIRRCIDFAKRWGYPALCMTNLFSLRETDPRKMKLHPVPNNVEGKTTMHYPNDEWLTQIADKAALIIAAWGRDGSHQHRGEEVMALLRKFRIHCLGTNSDGSPKHPLYLKADIMPMAYNFQLTA